MGRGRNAYLAHDSKPGTVSLREGARDVSFLSHDQLADRNTDIQTDFVNAVCVYLQSVQL